MVATSSTIWACVCSMHSRFQISLYYRFLFHEMLKCALFHLFLGLFNGLKVISLEEGFSGLYRGIGPTLAAIGPLVAVQQVSYDVLKLQAMKYGLSPSMSLFFVCGSAAGAISQTVQSH